MDAPENPLGGWWEQALGRLRVGEGARESGVTARAFAATADSVSGARDLAGRAADEWRLPETADDLRLIVSELVGNACRHAVPRGHRPEDTRVIVQLRVLPARRAVVCMVADSEPKAPVQVDAHHFAESGRGLGLVAAFSREWGWHPLHGHGKIVWALCGGEA